jgi:hypothetical protein
VTGGVAEDSASDGTAHERGSLRLVVARAPEIDRSQRISAVYSQLVGRVGSDFTSFSLSAPEFAMPIWLSDGGKIIFAARFCMSCWNDFQRNFERSRKPRANGHPCNGQNKAPKLSACLFRHPAPATIPSFPPSLSPSGRNTCRSAGRTGMNLPPTLPPKDRSGGPTKSKAQSGDQKRGALRTDARRQADEQPGLSYPKDGVAMNDRRFSVLQYPVRRT